MIALPALTTDCKGDPVVNFCERCDGGCLCGPCRADFAQEAVVAQLEEQFGGNIQGHDDGGTVPTNTVCRVGHRIFAQMVYGALGAGDDKRCDPPARVLEELPPTAVSKL